MIVGSGGAGVFWLGNSGVCAGESNCLLNTLCMAHPSGSLIRYAASPIFSLIWKGPYLFWPSFFDG